MSTGDVHQKLFGLLRHLPEHAVIEWGDDTSGDEPVLTDGLDVWAPALTRPLGLNWVWSITTEEPEDGIGALAIVVPSGETWTREFLSEVLREWTIAHTGRTDISYTYNPTLMSDWLADLVQRVRVGEDWKTAVESDDRKLHSIASHTAADGRKLTTCGLVVSAGWPRRSGELFFPSEMAEEEFDAEWDRLCC